METQTLQTEVREETGKGAARRLRAAGSIPAVFYGRNVEPRSLRVSPKELSGCLSTEWRRNVLLKVQVEGDERPAMVKELQVHPVTRQFIHVDLYEVDLEREVTVDVPLLTTGRAKGVVAGGELNVVFRTLPVRAKPDHIPAKIVVDVAPMELGEVFKIKDLKLADGVSVPLDPERNVIAVVSPRRRAAQEGEGAAEGAAASG